jgi:hypothetical protein
MTVLHNDAGLEVAAEVLPFEQRRAPGREVWSDIASVCVVFEGRHVTYAHASDELEITDGESAFPSRVERIRTGYDLLQRSRTRRGSTRRHRCATLWVIDPVRESWTGSTVLGSGPTLEARSVPWPTRCVLSS